MADIVVVGSINEDQLYRVDHLPVSGETVVVQEVVQNSGGKGANQAVAAARCGASVAMVGCVGADRFGYGFLAALKEEGIDSSGVIMLDGCRSGSAMVFVDNDGENSIAIQPGANGRVTPQQIEIGKHGFAGARYVLLQNEIPLASTRAVLQRAADLGRSVIWNPAPATGIAPGDLARVDILTPNQAEAKALCGITVADDDSAAQAARALHAFGVGTVLITLGAAGVWLSVDGEGSRLPGFVIEAIDTTGAGDTFNGALAAALCKGRDLQDAVTLGQAAAALAVGKRGAQVAIPREIEVLAFLDRYK